LTARVSSDQLPVQNVEFAEAELRACSELETDNWKLTAY